MKILVILIIFVFALSLFRMILEWSKNNNKCSHQRYKRSEITIYTGNQNYSHRMVLVSFFAVTNQLQLHYRI